MKTTFGGFADRCASLVTTPAAKAIIPVTAPRRRSRRVIGSFPPNPIEPPLTSMKCFFPDPLGLSQHQAVDAAADVPEVGLVPAIELANRAARVINFAKGFANGPPVDVAITEIHPLVAILFALEVLQVDLDNALPQRANPILWVAVKHHVPHVEPRLDPRALEFTDVLGHFQWAQQKFVPHFFDGNHNFQFFRERKQFSNLRLGTAPRVAIRSLRVDNRGYEQHGVRSPQLRVM